MVFSEKEFRTEDLRSSSIELVRLANKQGSFFSSRGLAFSSTAAAATWSSLEEMSALENDRDAGPMLRDEHSRHSAAAAAALPVQVAPQRLLALLLVLEDAPGTGRLFLETWRRHLPLVLTFFASKEEEDPSLLWMLASELSMFDFGKIGRDFLFYQIAS